MKALRIVPAGIGLLLLSLATNLAARPVPPLSGRVNDLADLVSPTGEQRISDQLAAFEGRTGAQVAVLTVDSLQGDNIEDFSLRVVEAWQLGRASDDDGALLLIARDDRKMRIEVGYGLEGELTDLESAAILDQVIRPRFQQGDFNGGIEQGVDAILGTLDGLDVLPEAPTGAAIPLRERLGGLLIWGIVISIFSLTSIFQSGCGSWGLYVFLMPFYFLFPMALIGPRAGLVFLLLWVIGFPILKYVFGNTAAGRSVRSRGMPWIIHSGGWGSGGGFSGGGFSGGGFSGGGGSFGGGGASGSW